MCLLNLEMATNCRHHRGEPGEGLVEAMQAARKAAEVSTLMLTYLGQSQASYEPLDLTEVCRRGLSALRAALPPGLVLQTELPAAGPTISANANQLQQILTILITNAAEASGGGQGGLRLSVKTVTAADIAAPTGSRFPVDWRPQDAAYACLEVADAGCGIVAQNIDKLFDPFFTTKFQGRGLGLSVVLGIMRAHNGAVAVESEPDRGSVFRVFFPVPAEAVAIRKRVPVAPLPRAVGGGTVLVVEDEPLSRKTLALVLQYFAFTVLEAEDGAAAVEIFSQHQDEIGCVVCDLTMPRMNGWETLTELRQLAPGLPVILVSGYDEAEVMSGDHPELPQAFLHKPYEVQVLIDAIHQLLPPRKASGAAPG
jgi:CheY-like chemotaxis protein